MNRPAEGITLPFSAPSAELARAADVLRARHPGAEIRRAYFFAFDARDEDASPFIWGCRTRWPHLRLFAVAAFALLIAISRRGR